MPDIVPRLLAGKGLEAHTAADLFQRYFAVHFFFGCARESEGLGFVVFDPVFRLNFCNIEGVREF